MSKGASSDVEGRLPLSDTFESASCHQIRPPRTSTPPPLVAYLPNWSCNCPVGKLPRKYTLSLRLSL
ncbi:uncharacterized protein SCHCODRAFT_02641633 [Schizophyllum commune H4-8]|uniref:uncharacterized protein n=1 Tax=Schizophyllum commune (strain H4-8 / FGSC 9210) TaxID=578458 RepID=UPI00215E98B4|nr:uncharacterized protein SCHCODRAFT_02641633 [Schizophyllum commune H4-8]KAI5886396.1 hypothetical protein SCHCODRAFT_02641633 [Schizophyllum commune H4-8]